jgi:hypothetical protein
VPLVTVDAVVGLWHSPCQVVFVPDTVVGHRRGVFVQSHCCVLVSNRAELVVSVVSTASGPVASLVVFSVSMAEPASMPDTIDAVLVAPVCGNQAVGIVVFVVPAIDRVVAPAVDEVYDRLVHPVYPVVPSGLASVPLNVDMVQRGLTGIQYVTLTGVVLISPISSARSLPTVPVRSFPFPWLA